MMAANIQSLYAGLAIGGWEKAKDRNLLNTQPKMGSSTSSYSDAKMELMGQDSRLAMAVGKMKRVCQLENSFSMNFVREMPERLQVCLSIDGENFALF